MGAAPQAAGEPQTSNRPAVDCWRSMSRSTRSRPFRGGCCIGWKLAANNPGARTPTLVSYTTLATDAAGPPVLGPPLAGSRSVAGNGCCAVGLPHRFSVQSINGRLVNAQRFAIDYMRLTEDGYLVKGDQKDVRNWAGYGAKVLAVANGTIVETLDGLPDTRGAVRPRAAPEAVYTA
jgi:hypothetical protein